MSVVINTNSAATMAANNLANSSQLLQKSLNRLSSGSRIVSPEDDAGGLAVAMKLTATAHRQAAVQNNIANSTSFLQTQDGVLGVVAKVLSRVSELKTLYFDPTKNSSDLANYDAEFSQLQQQLTSLSNEKFNGIALFGSSTLNVGTTESGGGAIQVGGINLMGAGGGTPTNFTFTGTNPTPFTPSGAGVLTVTSGGIFLEGDPGNWAELPNAGDTATYDGAGGWTFSGTGISTSGSMASGFTSVTMDGSVFTSYNGTATFTPSGGASNTSSVASASDLGALSLGTITGAIQDVATNRANNGAQQSRLGFAAEVLTTNKANIEAANSRITDVDVAQESTELARYNVLTQAGTAMLSQANQSTQIALKLLG